MLKPPNFLSLQFDHLLPIYLPQEDRLRGEEMEDSFDWEEEQVPSVPRAVLSGVQPWKDKGPSALGRLAVTSCGAGRVSRAQKGFRNMKSTSMPMIEYNGMVYRWKRSLLWTSCTCVYTIWRYLKNIEPKFGLQKHHRRELVSTVIMLRSDMFGFRLDLEHLGKLELALCMAEILMLDTG